VFVQAKQEVSRTGAGHCCICAPVLDCRNVCQKEDYQETEEKRPQEGETGVGGESSYEGGEEEARAEEGRKEEGRGSEAASNEGARG